MKIAQLLSQYLLQNKKLSLQGIGEFTVGSFYDNPFENEKGGSKLPENTISFRINPKTAEDPELIQYISLHSGKIKPLASADLDSFITTGRQLLNISKPFVIEGIGTLSRDAHNEIEFTQGVVAIHADEHVGKKHKSHSVESNNTVHFDDNYLKPAKSYDNTTRRILIWSAVLIGLAVIGWIGFYFFSPASSKQSGTTEVVSSPVVQPVVDSPSHAVADSLQKAKNDSIAAAALKPQMPSIYSYQIVIERAATKERALKRYKDLLEWGHKVVMTTKDSVTFKLAIPIKGPLSDSARNRDSLTRFFVKRTYVDLSE